MPNRRIYAAASGQCLVRNTPDVDEAERERVLRNFHAGVRLVVDAPRQEVRGFVPAERRSPEAFFAVVQANDADDPMGLFYDTVVAEFDRRDHWAIRTDTPEGEPFRAAAADSDRSGDHCGNVNNSSIDGEGTPLSVTTEIRNRLRDRSATDPPITVAVAEYRIALAVLNELSASGSPFPWEFGTITVTRDPDVDHLDLGLQFWLRDGQTGVEFVDATAPTEPTESTKPEAPDGDDTNDPRDSRAVVFGTLLAAVLVATVGIARGSVAVAFLGVAMTIAAGWVVWIRDKAGANASPGDRFE